MERSQGVSRERRRLEELTKALEAALGVEPVFHAFVVGVADGRDAAGVDLARDHRGGLTESTDHDEDRDVSVFVEMVERSVHLEASEVRDECARIERIVVDERAREELELVEGAREPEGETEEERR